MTTIEGQRLQASRSPDTPWKKWGPYLSERQWGTVREDYSESGDAWNYFSHDQARSRAYHWGEDGLAGISDDKQLLCFALALWNGQDPILKERLFGLTNSEGNHGEDVKEYYFYLDSTPTHSYMKYLYKYPQAAYPYDQIVRENKARSRKELEYELIDTGVFDEDRYFDVFVEYAKADVEDLLILITVANRGPEAAELTVLPTLWFRNTWAWSEGKSIPSLKTVQAEANYSLVLAEHEILDKRALYCETAPQILFTNNETNLERIFGIPNTNAFVKDGINNYVVHGQQNAVNPANTGTKAAVLYKISVPPGGTVTLRLRLAPEGSVQGDPFASFDQTFALRRAEADQFYDSITPDTLTPDEHNVFRQALAGMLWSKQYYGYDVDPWLRGVYGNPVGSLPRASKRNAQWFHMVNEDILSMPDKWEYPWYAAWDLAFHTLALQVVDTDFAKEQLLMMLSPDYLHPNGQIPAYEWNFSDVNPPVHAWAVHYLFQREKQLTGAGDVEFLQASFQKLLLNFAWWVNRKDRFGSNVFEGGFLGLDNIGVFDRSAPLPTGGYLEQADGTAWMAFYCQMMMGMAIELFESGAGRVYEDFACQFLEQFLLIAGAMDRLGDNVDELWDEEDGFFYDLMRLPDGSAFRLKVRSMVGLLPLAATLITRPGVLEKMPALRSSIDWFRVNRPDIVANLSDLGYPNQSGNRLLAVTGAKNLQRILQRMLDESEFLSPHGIRALSRHHLEHPFTLEVNDGVHRVDYEPAESSSGLFGGNSNWRGPIWIPVNLLLLRSLLNLYTFFEDDVTIECPTGSGQQKTLWEVTLDLTERLCSIFLRDSSGRRPVYGDTEKFQSDPHWRDLILFYEYFHGDNGAGLGASHQTGWSGCVAMLLQLTGIARMKDGKERLVSGVRIHLEDPKPVTAKAGAEPAISATS